MRHTGLIILALAIGAWLTLAGVVRAEESTIEFNLPAGEATVQLLRFSDLTGREIMYAAEVVRGMRTNAVQGKFTVREAMDRLLAGTPLQMREDAKTGAFAIVKADGYGRAALTPDQPPPAASRDALSQELKPSNTTKVKTSKRKKLLSWMTAVFVASGSTTMHAQEATPAAQVLAVTQPTTDADSDLVTTLPEFTISESKESDYRSAETISAARIRGSLLETPQSVSVLTREFMNDVSPVRLYDATRYVAGITEGRGPTFSDRIIIRGFENDGRTVDNFLLSTTANFDESLVERVEVVKGPNAILSPTGAPGGSVNVITKSPQFKQSTTLTGTVGLYDAQRFSLDTTGPLGAKSGLAYRVIGAFQDSDRNWKNSKLKQTIFSPQLAYRISPTTLLTFKYFYADYSSWGDPRVLVDPSISGNADGVAMAGFTRDGRNGSNSWNHRDAYLNKADLVLNTSFGDHISMRLATDYVYNRDVSELGQLTFPGTTNRYNPYTGILTPDYTWALDSVTGQYQSSFSPYVVDRHNITRASTLNYGWNQAAALQNDWALSYTFHGISSTTIAGGTIQRTQVRSLSKNGVLPNFDLDNPDVGDDVRPVYTDTRATSTISRTIQEQLYALERFGFFDDRVYLSGGVSHIVVNSATTDLRSNAGAAVLDGNHNTTNFGFLGKPVKNVSVYYNYSGNAVPTTFNNQPIWMEGKQHEFGVKSEFFKRRLAISVARFQITQTNVSIPNPEYQLDKSQPQNLLYDLRNTGQEIEISGSITKQLNIVASAALMHTRDKFGRRPRAIADRQAALLVNYHFDNASLKGLAVYFGTSYTGDAEGDAPPAATVLGVIAQSSFKVAGYTKCSAGATYKWDNYTLRLSGDNVLNAKYLYSPGARFAVASSPMPNVTMSLSIRL